MPSIWFSVCFKVLQVYSFNYMALELKGTRKSYFIRRTKKTSTNLSPFRYRSIIDYASGSISSSELSGLQWWVKCGICHVAKLNSFILRQSTLRLWHSYRMSANKMRIKASSSKQGKDWLLCIVTVRIQIVTFIDALPRIYYST